MQYDFFNVMITLTNCVQLINVIMIYLCPYESYKYKVTYKSDMDFKYFIDIVLIDFDFNIH